MFLKVVLALVFFPLWVFLGGNFSLPVYEHAFSTLSSTQMSPGRQAWEGGWGEKEVKKENVF